MIFLPFGLRLSDRMGIWPGEMGLCKRNAVPALSRSCQGWLVWAASELVGSHPWKCSRELERSCVRVVDACVGRRRPFPTIQLCVLVCLLQTCGTRISSWGSFTCGDFYKSSGKSSVPTLVGPPFLSARHSKRCMCDLLDRVAGRGLMAWLQE